MESVNFSAVANRQVHDQQCGPTAVKQRAVSSAALTKERRAVAVVRQHCQILYGLYGDTQHCQILYGLYGDTQHCQILYGLYGDTQHCQILYGLYGDPQHLQLSVLPICLFIYLFIYLFT